MAYNNYNKNPNAEDEWNMNAGWVEYLNNLLVLYGESSLSDDFYKMYKCLNLIENTLSPKVERDIVEINLKKIRDNIRKMIIRNPDGTIIKMYPQLVEVTTDLLDDTYRHLIIKMDKAGVLTRTPKDPNKAFGNFRGS